MQLGLFDDVSRAPYTYYLCRWKEITLIVDEFCIPGLCDLSLQNKVMIKSMALRVLVVSIINVPQCPLLDVFDWYPHSTHRHLKMHWCILSTVATGAPVWKHHGPLLLTWFDFNPSMDNNHTPSKVWDGITYPFLNFNGCTVEVYE